MKRILVVAIAVINLLLIGSLALGNPGLLPKHPGYPMGNFKDPVLGVSTANDPGETQPSPQEALKQAAAFHDAHAINPMNEIRPNVVYDEPNMMTSVSTTNQKSDGNEKK
ncbi:MAG TPA: hypothetical protein PKK23_11980 [Nitrospirales bacterium]|nr:hypothetical protein [Nitrospiraceae bacterium]HNP29759.1 hypothetical protein [Nitrospirales bacterium]